ncbi:basic phospholipase A2 RVV-VD-like [Patiria miniata]|uniref:Phospholipase A2 n=1 Tax=Patiria miniata TaxID=46514 RepID=A0A914BI38_PATMI|nr:basic phospholipase A2 RVV-VD-like [Patiria miniata]
MAGKSVMFLFVCALTLITEGQAASRQKRSLPQFALMMTCATGTNPLEYNGYGCYCGSGGGGTPVDATDRCCYAHDQCYSRLKSDGHCVKETGDVYTMLYRSKQKNCGQSNVQITCKRARQYNWLESLAVFWKTNCAAGACECDRQAALCFKRNRGTFSRSYVNYHKYTRCRY